MYLLLQVTDIFFKSCKNKQAVLPLFVPLTFYILEK